MATRPKLVKCGLGEHGLRGSEEYLLPGLWCLHLYFYDVQIEIAGAAFNVLPGSLTLIPPAARIVYHYSNRRHRHFFVHFAVSSKRQPFVSMPVCRHLPEAMDELLDRLENIQRIHTHNPMHAEIALWSLLWDLAESAKRSSHPRKQDSDLAQKIDELIALKLPDHITPRSLSQELGLSAAHLNRTVKARHGITTVQLIRKRRLQRAYHLLLHSTMPIKMLAAESGIEDLQQFNKLMRREYGKSPRVLRELHEPGHTWASERR